MKKEMKNRAIGASGSLLAAAAVLLVVCAGASQAQFSVEVPAGEEWDIDYPINSLWLDVYGTANLLPGEYVDWGIYVYGGGALNVHAGSIGAGSTITVFSGATVTVYGTDFEDSTGSIPTGSWTPPGGADTLTGTYENGSGISLHFTSSIPITLAEPGAANLPPVAIAGQEGLIGEGGKIHPIYSSDQSTTSVLGQASDPEEEPIEYRWLEGTDVLLDWTAVTTPPQAYLDLSTVPPFSVGDHTLTLEVREAGGEMLEASDDMILRVLGAPEITEIAVDPAALGEETTVKVTFTDPDEGIYPNEVTINWGDDEEGTIAEATSPLTAGHTYAATGVYTVTVTLKAKSDGPSVSATAYAAVYDPEAFTFVTGAGWIPYPEATCGKAFFGFLCRQWGDGSPVGRMRFRYGENRFRATEFDWLVLDDDGTASFAGVGTINDAGSYYFMVDITEDPDSIDIFIVGEDGYDTGGLVGLGRGQIRIRQWTW